MNFTPQELFLFWNANRGLLPRALMLTRKRAAHANAQLEKYPDREHWSEVLNRWLASSFCMAQWKPCFDDFLNENKRISTLEGRYDNREKTKALGTENDARKILAAIKAYPSGRTEEIRSFLGEDLFKKALKVPGGFSAIRQMPANDFTVKKLANELKESGAA